MRTNLQYFADPDTDPEDDKKYTQDDVNRMMAAKDKEMQQKLDDEKAKYQSQINSDFEAKKNDLIEQGKQLAGETAQQEYDRKLKAKEEVIQRKSDDLDKREQAYKQRDALEATEKLLADKKIHKRFAKQLTDLDEATRTNNVEEFAEAWTEALNQGIDAKVTGTKTPQTGSASIPATITKDDFNKLSVSEQMQAVSEHPELKDKFF